MSVYFSINSTTFTHGRFQETLLYIHATLDIAVELIIEGVKMIKDNTIPRFEDSSHPPELSVKEAGKRGGQATLRKHGRTFFSKIGRKGGKRTAQLYRAMLTDFGKRGGRQRRPQLVYSPGHPEKQEV